MEKVQINNFIVSGIKTRTNNKNEQDIKTSKIGKLWEEFYEKKVIKNISNKKADGIIYEVYSSYESDYQGDFDITIGTEVTKGNENLENIHIEKGEYLVFKAKGDIPKVVIDTWVDIWNFFKTSKIKRAYTTDFEKYISNEEVEIYIAIK